MKEIQYASYTVDPEVAGGRLPLTGVIPGEVVQQIILNAQAEMDSMVRRILGWDLQYQGWEERLAAAIEERSLRGRARALRRRLYFWRWQWSDRLSLAWDALRGRHECDW